MANRIPARRRARATTARGMPRRPARRSVHWRRAAAGCGHLPVEQLEGRKHGADGLVRGLGQSGGVETVEERLGPAAGQVQARLPQQGPDENDGPRARPYQGLAHRDLPPHMPLRLRRPVRWPVGPQSAGLGQGPGIATVRLHPAMPLPIHRRVVRIGDDDLMAQLFETPCNPLALGPRLDQDAGSGMRLEHGGKAIALGADAPLDDFTVLLQDADLTHPSAEMYATIGHGWSSWVAP